MNKPLPIMIPIYKWWEVPYMWIGAKVRWGIVNTEWRTSYASRIPVRAFDHVHSRNVGVQWRSSWHTITIERVCRSRRLSMEGSSGATTSCKCRKVVVA